jgi:hypothetical protein
MNIQRGLLGTYRLLLKFYPAAFRQRFAPEMMELAEAAEPGEWPLIFGDTSVAIVRCWFEGSPSTAALAEPNPYIALGGSSASSFGLGFVLSTAVLAGLLYAGYRWPPPCQSTKPILTNIVGPPQARASAATARLNARD